MSRKNPLECVRLRRTAHRLGQVEAYLTVREVLSEVSTASDVVLSRERSGFYRCRYATLGLTLVGLSSSLMQLRWDGKICRTVTEPIMRQGPGCLLFTLPEFWPKYRALSGNFWGCPYLWWDSKGNTKLLSGWKAVPCFSWPPDIRNG